MDWISDLAENTTKIEINRVKKHILLVHPHFKRGTVNYRRLLKNLKSNQYHGYTVEALGFCSFYGVVILDKIATHLRKDKDNVESVSLRFNDTYSRYRLQVKFK